MQLDITFGIEMTETFGSNVHPFHRKYFESIFILKLGNFVESYIVLVSTKALLRKS